MGRVNVILDRRHSEREAEMLLEFEAQGITEYKFWDCIILPSVVQSINASHKMIVQDAKDNGLSEVCIFEDDCYFRKKDGWNYFVKNKPESFDVYVGGCYLVDNRNKYEAPLVKVNEWVGNHCIIVHSKYYDTFLSLPHDQHIDTINAGKGDFYLCFPYPALQRAGMSANAPGEPVNYNSMLPPEFIY